MEHWEYRSVVEYTPKMYEALNSVSINAKKKKNKTKFNESK